MSVSINGTNGLTFSDGSSQATAWVPGMRNRIINGDFRIDQRNAGASVSISTGSANYTIDRWSASASGGGVFTAQRSTVVPAGFSNSFGLTVTTIDSSIASNDYYIFEQQVEGFNCADLGFGTASASTVTLGFWVRSSLTGLASGRLCNSALNRSYVFTYTVNAANTWEYKTVSIAGDTSGTWLTDSGRGMSVTFNLASGSGLTTSTIGSWTAGNYHGASTQTLNFIGTNGATFYITGVQLEKGSTATSFDYRSYGTELALCQRYYWKLKNTTGTNEVIGVSTSYTTNDARTVLQYPVTMRALPSSSISSGASYFKLEQNLTNIGVTTLNTAYTSATSSLLYGIATGATGGQGGVLYTNDTGAFISFSSEL